MANKVISNLLLTDEALVGVTLEDRISVPTNRTLTDAGQMHVPCKFARTGTQLYSAKQLGIKDADPKAVVTVYRDEADVFDEASIESFRSAPVTIGHPKNEDGSPIPLTSDNSKDLQVGMLEGMPTRDEDTLGGVLILAAQEAIDALESGTQELSAGYTCDIELVDGKHYQRNIRANHIAIVDKGRAGSSCRISDEALELTDESLVLKAKLADCLKESSAVLKRVNVEVADGATLVETIKLLDKALTETESKLLVKSDLLVDANGQLETKDVELTSTKLKLVDAELAATQGVIERCDTLESARLIADMRDLGSKSVSEIKRMVVIDQMPEKDLKGKSEAYFDAMFEILVDHSKGETPMSKIFKEQSTHITVDAKPTDPVAEARQAMINRNKSNKDSQ